MLKLKTIPVQWKTPLKIEDSTSAVEESTITEDNAQVENDTSAVEDATQRWTVPVQWKSLP